MRQLYLIHLIALITLFCAGLYWIGEIEQVTRTLDFDFGGEESALNNRVRLTRLAAFAGMVVFAFSAMVGWRTHYHQKIVGRIWTLAGIGGVVWMALMWKSPTHISLLEVFPFWIFYVILGIAASAYSIAVWKERPRYYPSDYEEDVLDN